MDRATLTSIIDKVAGLRVLVIGDLMLDIYLYGQAERLSPEAPVPVLLVDHEEDRLGGAANVANNIKALGAQPILMGIIGQDAAAERFLTKLHDHNISTQSILKTPQYTTATKTRVIARGQQIVRIDHERPQPITPSDAKTMTAMFIEAIKHCHAVIFSDYGKGLFTPQWLKQLIGGLPKDLYSSVDPFPDHLPFYQGIVATTPNRAEALKALRAEAWQTFNHEALAKELMTKSQFGEVFVTLGAEGMIWCNRDMQTGYHPTRAKQVYDVSGAGDTVIAALTLARSQGIGIDLATQFANLAAGLVVGKPGTATISPAELLTHID